jgi:hypothetical protein
MCEMAPPQWKEITGHNGVSLYDYWAEGYKTSHGLVTRGVTAVEPTEKRRTTG